jgi:hypothetical protein
MQETLLETGAQTEYHVPLEEYPRSVLLGAIRRVSISELGQKSIDLLISSGADIFCDCGTSSPLEAAIGNVFVGVSLNVIKAALRKWSLWLQVLNVFTTVDTRLLSERYRWYRILKKSMVNAARIGRIALMDRLIKAGADPFLQLPGELSPLEAAAQAGSVRAVKNLILVHGVDPKWYGEEWWRSQQARLLRLSLNESDASLISFFIDQNKDILKSDAWHHQALSYAIENDLGWLVRLTIEKCNIDPSTLGINLSSNLSFVISRENGQRQAVGPGSEILTQTNRAENEAGNSSPNGGSIIITLRIVRLLLESGARFIFKHLFDLANQPNVQLSFKLDPILQKTIIFFAERYPQTSFFNPLYYFLLSSI